MRRLEQPAVRPDGLQMEDHRSHQEKLWTVERCAWVLFIAITLGAAAGITGAGGVLSRQVAAIDGGKIDHPRIARSEAADEMTVRFAPGSGPRTQIGRAHAELQSLMRHSYAVFCLKKKKQHTINPP